MQKSPKKHHTFGRATFCRGCGGYRGAGIAGLWKRGAAFELERKTAKRIGRKRETKRDTRSPDQREREDLLNKTLQKLLRRHAKGCYVIFLPKKTFSTHEFLPQSTFPLFLSHRKFRQLVPSIFLFFAHHHHPFFRWQKKEFPIISVFLSLFFRLHRVQDIFKTFLPELNFGAEIHQ